MDRAAVAAFYRAKGYTVHESMVATGHSGNGHRVPLLCEGPLGNLAVFFGDEGGIDGPEMGGARRVSKDLGATPVLAAASFTNAQRNTAAELGVVLLDRDAIAPEAPIATIPVGSPRRAWPEPAARAAAKPREDPFADHPWPDSGRPGGRDAGRTAMVDVDDLLAGLGRPATPPPLAAAPPPANASVPPLTAPTSADGLWRKPRATRSVLPTAEPVHERSANAGRFAWLGAKATPVVATAASGLEHDGVVQAADVAPVATEPTAPTVVEAAAEANAELWRRQAVRAQWMRRAAWIGGGALAVYLFALWWF